MNILLSISTLVEKIIPKSNLITLLKDPLLVAKYLYIKQLTIINVLNILTQGIASYFGEIIGTGYYLLDFLKH